MKQIDLEQWLNKRQSWFLPDNFDVVKNFLSKLNEEAIDKLCSKKLKLKNIVNSITDSNLASLCSPKTMMIWSIFGVPPEVQYTMHTMYSVLYHWLWYALTFIKCLWWLIVIVGFSTGNVVGILAGLIVLVWYVYDLVTVKKRTQKFNFKVFCYATGYNENDAGKETISLENKSETSQMNVETTSKAPKERKPNIKVLKIMSIIGLVLYFLAIAWFCNEVVVCDFNFDCFYADGQDIILLSAFFAMLYSVIGLFLSKKDKVVEVMSIIGAVLNLFVLSILIWYEFNFYDGELLSPFAGILFVLYNIPYVIVVLKHSLKTT